MTVTKWPVAERAAPIPCPTQVLRSGRLLSPGGGRSKKAFETWLAARGKSWRKKVEVVAMDGFTGFRNAADEELSKVWAVMGSYARRVPGRRQGR